MPASASRTRTSTATYLTYSDSNNRDYVLATVGAIEAAGFRDQPLHQLAQTLHKGAAPHRLEGLRTREQDESE